LSDSAKGSFNQYRLGHQAGDELLSTIDVSLKHAIGVGARRTDSAEMSFYCDWRDALTTVTSPRIIDAVRGRVSLRVGVSYGTAQLGPREPLDHAMRHADKMMSENKIRTRRAVGVGVGVGVEDGPSDRYPAAVGPGSESPKVCTWPRPPRRH
jgi:hypothetical protein